MKSIMLLLALMVSNVAFARSEQARPDAACADIAMLNDKLDAFAAYCGRYPTTAEGLQALVNYPTNIPVARWHGPYLDRLPTDPWGNGYVYLCPGVHNPKGFDLYSCGEDQTSKSGGNDPDDINNWDPNSPRGTFSDHVGTCAGIAIISLFVVTLISGVGLSVASVFSRRARDFTTKHAIARKIFIWVSLLGLLLFLLSLSIPRIAT